jgi:hypothetical protein
MRKFKYGIMTLAASAAVFAPAGIASATGGPQDHNDGQCNGSINVASCFTVDNNELTLLQATVKCVGASIPIAVLGINQTSTCQDGSQVVRISPW